MRPSAVRSQMSLRALVLGVLFAVLICFVVSYAELVIAYIQIGFLQLPPAVIGLFFFIIVLNRLTGRFNRRLSLSQQELMVVYCMMLLASMISSRGLMEKLIPALIAVNYYANESNEWAEIFFKNMRPQLVPFDVTKGGSQPIAVSFYENIDPNQPIPWREWIPPLLTWGVVVVLIFFGFLCLASILRRQWVDNEKLTFPLVQLPLEFVRDSETHGFFSNRLMWIGVAIPVLIFSLNGLHNIRPVVPHLNLNIYLNRYFTEKPFSAMFYTPAFISFAAIGFFYLLPVQLLFSLWFFFVMTRVQDIVAAVMGQRISNMPLYPTRSYIGYQVAGAYFVLIAYLVYVSLPHLRAILKRTFAGGNGEEDSNELLPYRVAVWGLILSFGLAVIWCWWAGLTVWFALFELAVYMFLVAIVMARSVAEGGMLMTETSFRPIDLYVMFRDKASLGGDSVTFLSFFDAIFTRDQRGLILTGFLDSLKFADGVRIKRRALLPVFSVAILVALVTSAAIHLYLPYRHGGNYMYSYVYRGNPIWAFRDYASAAAGIHTGANPKYLIPFFAGVAVTAFLAIMRTLYWWWPFHPLGYALSASWTMIVFWFPVLIAWLVKYPVMRYGGMRQYLKLKPFFLGMIFGEFSMAVLWTTISWLTGAPAPFFPWP